MSEKIPDRFDCTAVGRLCGEEKVVRIVEWWYDGKLVETIEESAESVFYEIFDKHPFTITSIVKVAGIV